MNFARKSLLFALVITSVQCQHKEGSSATSTDVSVFRTGRYELVEFSILTELDQLLTEEDYSSWSGSLRISDIALEQIITTEGVESVVIDDYLINFDSDERLSGTIDLLNPQSPYDLIEFEAEGDEMIFRLEGETELGVSYVETDRWRKVSDVP